MNYLGKYLKKRLKQLRMSEREISIKCGLSHSYLNQLIKGVNPTTSKSISPTLKTFEKLSIGFDIPVETLQKIAMGFKENKTNKAENPKPPPPDYEKNKPDTISASQTQPETTTIQKRRGRKKKTDLINKTSELMGCSYEFIEQIQSFQSFMNELGFNRTKKNEEEWILIMSGIREALRKYIARSKYSIRKKVSPVSF